MNKITSALAGLALVAAVSVAPAMAQGNLFSPPGTFTFLDGGSFTASGSGETFNPLTGTPDVGTASFTLAGAQTAAGSPFYNLTKLTVTGANVGGAGINTLTETGPLQFLFATSTTGVTTIASVGAAADGTTFNLVTAPVPEASTVVSFGALLALGGLAVVLRRKGVKNAA